MAILTQEEINGKTEAWYKEDVLNTFEPMICYLIEKALKEYQETYHQFKIKHIILSSPYYAAVTSGRQGEQLYYRSFKVLESDGVEGCVAVPELNVVWC